VPVAAAVPDVPPPVAWGLGVGIFVLIAAVGTSLAMIRRRPQP
jgi:hypothetical protein